MLNAAKAVGNAAGTLADNYKFSKELEARKPLHMVLDGMKFAKNAGTGNFSKNDA